MTRLETIHALLRRMEQAYRSSLSSPALEELGAAPEPELFAQLSECRELFAEELARVITSIKGELSSPVDVLSNPRELRSALRSALDVQEPDYIHREFIHDIDDDGSLDRAARSLLS